MPIPLLQLDSKNSLIKKIEYLDSEAIYAILGYSIGTSNRQIENSRIFGG